MAINKAIAKRPSMTEALVIRQRIQQLVELQDRVEAELATLRDSEAELHSAFSAAELAEMQKRIQQLPTPPLISTRGPNYSRH